MIKKFSEMDNSPKPKKEDQKKKYEYDILEMTKKYDTEQKRLEAEKTIALEYFKNQPIKITYNHIYWW